MGKHDEIVVGLDLGSTKVCAVVAEYQDRDNLRVLGAASAPNAGIKQGMVVSVDQTADAIRKAVAEAEAMSGVEIHSVSASVCGVHLRGINNRTTVGVRGDEVTAHDVATVLDAVRAVELSRDDEVLHVSPQGYVLDAQDAIADPIGIAGDRLCVEAHVITGASTTIQNISRCIMRANLGLNQLVPQPLASALAVLSPEELELGVAVADIGGGTTDVTVFAGGSVCHTWVLPMGGSHVTNDIAQGLSTTVREAERIKIQFGTAQSTEQGPDEQLELPGVGGHAPTSASRQLLAEIIEARVEEILSLMHEDLLRTGLLEHIGSGLVLTGGGSLSPGTCALATDTTGMICRRGASVGISGLTDLASTPQNATAVGLTRHALQYAQDSAITVADRPNGLGWIKRALGGFF